MAINSIFIIKNQPRIGYLFFDASLREKHDYDLTITENPVEAGANIADDILVNPRIVEVDVVVGDVQQILGFSYSAFNTRQRSSDALAQLWQLAIARQPLTVILYLAKYQNFFIKHISATRTAENSTTLIATVTLQEVFQVDSQAGSLNLSNANSQHQPVQNSGVKQGVPTT